VCRYQYRLKVNGTIGPILDTFPGEKWTEICVVIDARGGTATLERRLITDHDILPMLADPTGFIKLKDNTVVCPWEVLAGMENN
jgi:hypothetical protein